MTIMQEYKLNILSREAVGRGPARRLRLAGRIPCSLYGQGQARSVSVDADEFRVLKASLVGQSALIELKDDAGETVLCLVQAIQRDAIRDTIKHIDFLKIEQGQSFNATVPLRITDEETCIGVKQSAGVLEQTAREVTVRTTPENLPASIEVSVANLDAGASITVGDMVALEGVQVLGATSRVLIACQAQAS